MIVEETLYEANGIRMFVEKEDHKPTPQKQTCQCGRTVCCGKHKGCRRQEIRFVKDTRCR